MNDAMVEAADGWHYDGVTAVRRAVRLETLGDEFVLVEADRVHGPFAFADLRSRGHTGAAAVYALEGRPGWRLGLDGAVPAGIAARLPGEERYGRLIDRHGLGKAIIVFVALSIAAVAVVWTAPQWLAPLIPASVERRLGDAMVGDFGGRFCDAPAGRAALTKLTRRIAPDGQDLQVEVANIGIVNAVALPGGKVILFDQLVREADGPDEVAGVLGHEIGHVRNRDVMQALLKQMGLSVVLGGMSGDVGGYVNVLASATNSRTAEARADGFAIEAMNAASVSPAPTAAFFRRLAKGEPEDGRAASMLGYLSSHPLSRSRERAFTGAVRKGTGYKPALSTEEWIALRRICRDDPDVSRERGFGMF